MYICTPEAVALDDLLGCHVYVYICTYIHMSIYIYIDRYIHRPYMYICTCTPEAVALDDLLGCPELRRAADALRLLRCVLVRVHVDGCV